MDNVDKHLDDHDNDSIADNKDTDDGEAKEAPKFEGDSDHDGVSNEQDQDSGNDGETETENNVESGGR